MAPIKKPKIYILGASGFLGGQCAEYFRSKGYSISDKRLDITNSDVLKRAFASAKPDVVINFAGVRAYPNIDWCEDHKEETLAVNVAGAINVMLAALACGAYPIQISSGCVYAGGPGHAFTEEDEPNFYGSFYSRARIILQKTLSEMPVLYTRIRMPISSRPHSRNTITKIAAYKEVISVPNSVTLTEDLWPVLERLIRIKPIGVLNLTNEGYVEHKELLRAYKKIVDPGHSYIPIKVKELKTKAKRSNCVLSMAKARSLGISMPKLTGKRIEEIMRKYKEHLSK
jgi:dTDP-4-dehydrorhamnose reductase